MKIVLKLLATPVVMILTVFIGLCVVLLHISALILGLAGTVVALLGLAVLITYSVKNGIILLVIAFLLSPFGLPMLAVRVLGVVQDVNPARIWRLFPKNRRQQSPKTGKGGFAHGIR